MALARIRTLFPEEVSQLSEALSDAGYTVEILRPGETRIAPADLELCVDKLPVVEAWRRLPEAENVFVSPGTPESGEIRSSAGSQTAREPLLPKLHAAFQKKSSDLALWASQQAKEMRSYMHELRAHAHKASSYAQDLRRRWTPPRDYHAPVYPDAAALVEKTAPPVDPAIEQARLQQEELHRQQLEQARIQQEEARRQQELLRRRQEAEKQEELRLRQEAAKRELEEQAHRAEENRRRAREAAEAKTMLEKQRQMEAMVQATEALRQRAIRTETPKPRPERRQRPRFLPRTRRERAFFQAGVAAFVLALSLAAVSAAAFHPRPAATAIPQVAHVDSAVAKPAPAAPIAVATPVSLAPATPAVPAEVKSQASAQAPTPAPKPSAARTTAVRRASQDTTIADDEVTVRRARPAKSQAKQRPTQIAHYSDLD